MQWFWLALGGSFGALARYGLTQWVAERSAAEFPWATLAVNLTGCFAIGVVATLADERELVSPTTRLFLVTGLLGGFTTFSAFGLDTFRMIEAGRVAAAFGNAIASVALGIAAVVAGITVTRQLV